VKFRRTSRGQPTAWGPAEPPATDQGHIGDPDEISEVSWRHMLAAFSVRPYAWYWSSQLLSGLGTWSQAIAQAWLVLELTHSESRAAVWIGTITMLQFLPLLAFAVVGGVLADRVPRRKLLIATQSASAIQALALAALVISGTVQLWEVGVLAFLLGTTNAFNNPAQQSFVPEIVGRRLVADAVALNSVQFSSARMIGGALGGVSVAFWGVSGTALVNAASFLPAIAVLTLIRPAYATIRQASTHTSVFSELRTGVEYALSTVPIRRVVLIFGVTSLFGLNWQVAALGAGSLLGALFVARDRRATERRLIAGGLALGAALVLIGSSHSYPVTLVLVAAGGVAGIMVSVTANTRLQLLVPDHLRGRVMGIYVLLMGGTTPIGAFLLGEISAHFGPAVGIVVFGVATLATVGFLAVFRRARGSIGPPAPSHAHAVGVDPPDAPPA
jgi:MFS family permease